MVACARSIARGGKWKGYNNSTWDKTLSCPFRFWNFSGDTSMRNERFDRLRIGHPFRKSLRRASPC